VKLRILLINPWIYDFAAANLWSRPLGLLNVAERLSIFNVELSLIDCTDVLLKTDSGRGKYPKERVEKPECLKQVPRTFGRYGITPEAFRLRLSKAAPFDLVFVTSIMSWWYPGVQKVIEIIREGHKSVPIVLGGIYATLWHRHASSNSGADFIFNGPAEDDIKVVLNTFGFRLKKKAEVASPYYKLDLYSGHPFAPVMTGTGCPFSCAYCASGILRKNFSQRTPREVVDEIKELSEKGVRDFAFYDDALLVDADRHIRPILDEIKTLGIHARFHCPNGLHARFIDDGLARLMRDSGFRTIRLGLETVYAERQKETGGKVTCEDLASAVGYLKRQGFTKKEIGVYLMYGLPGQALNEVREGMAFLMSLGVRVHLAEFSPIPGTKCWKDLEHKGTVKENMDPLLTNNTVFSYLFSGYDPHEVDKLKLAVKNHNML
jgi:radical SAM superfamily enzyme YgiQ (UPF0313 family)